MALTGCIHKCLLCGTSADLSANYPYLGNQSFPANVFTTWKNECATAMCDILFEDKVNHFIKYFQNAQYCSYCEQLVRDVGFTWKQLKRFKNEIDSLTAKIYKLLDFNYRRITEKSNINVVEERTSCLLNTAINETILNYSHEELVEIIHTDIFLILTVTTDGQNLQEKSNSMQPLNSNNSDSVKNEETISPSLIEKDNIQIEQRNYEVATKFQVPVSTESYDDDIISEIKAEENSDFNEDYPEHILPHFEACYNDLPPDIFQEDNSTFDISENNERSESDNETENTDTTDSLNHYKTGPRKNRNNRPTHKSLYQATPESNESPESESDEKMEIQFYCKEENCCLPFSNQRSLTRHFFNAHQKCSVCGRRFATETELTLHNLNSHLEPNPFQCAFCPKLFENREDLLNHTNLIHPKICKVFSCPQCDKKLLSRPNLKSHIYHVHEKTQEEVLQDPFQCSFCGKRYADEKEITLHYSNSHQEPNPFQCAFCPELYSNRKDLTQHTKEFHPNQVGQYKCDVCGKGYLSIQSMKDHHRVTHDRKNLSFKCSVCAKTFLKKSRLNRHHMIAHKSESTKCETCGKMVKSHNLNIHHRNNHKEGGYICQVCGTKLETRFALKRHELEHNKIVLEKIKGASISHDCKFCGKHYQDEEQLKSHYSQAHQGPNPFASAFCPEIYSNSFDLQKHVNLIHSDPQPGKKRFQCDVCETWFAWKKGLQRHYSQFHGDPSLLLKCEVCQLGLPDKDFLMQHMKSHAKESNFVCEACGKMFKTDRSLKIHSKRHDEAARNVKCKICDKMFFDKASCMKHERTHTDIKEFVCEVCGKSFNHPANLYEHRKIHTGDPSRIRKRKPKSPSNLQSQ